MCIINSSSVLLPFVAGCACSAGIYLSLTTPSRAELLALWRVSRGRVASVLSLYRLLRPTPMLAALCALVVAGGAS